MNTESLHIRVALSSDVDALFLLEQQAFSGDRLSKRRFRHWVKAENAVLLVIEQQQQLLGYTLVLLHRGTRLARLYSIAVSAQARGKGAGRKLLEEAERVVADMGWLFMRLEVAKENHTAITLYKSMGYSVFGEYSDYYEDHQDALRMQKRIRHIAKNHIKRNTPWYQQSTEFTCGSSSLMMAMASLDSSCEPNQALELDIWREATTIFMTTGHGGTHPVGLALAAMKRGFAAQVWMTQNSTLFIEGVRNPKKKAILQSVDQQFHYQAQQAQLPIHFADISQQQIEELFNQGAAILILISTYRMDGKKAPHWVTVSGMDEHCLYVHDPDVIEGEQSALDCQYMPIARREFEKMSQFGKNKLRTAVAIWPRSS